ncbi:hypothetical protein SAY86_011434 [Trapa natans]|uniref:Late embryogenesis abundant protein LEA-2 subgroup domain-containing protein n=1 Tax=Trapa natans TaxID=22666 RepID=A0AAN7LK99_TRANT|nr:hypothetical protein SAY86_011434 [Trapa natans]
MTEKAQQVYPLAPANGAPRSDEDGLAMEKEAKRKKRVKLAIYIGVFAVFQVIVILVFGMVIMRVHRPKFRVGNLTVQNLAAGTGSFNGSFVAPVRVKNANFGPYKYEATTVFFSYGRDVVGRADVTKSKANFKSTKKIDLEVAVSSSNLTASDPAAVSKLSGELGSGTLTLRIYGNMTGKVELMLIFKKRKSTFMDCTMVINVSAKSVKSLECK